MICDANKSDAARITQIWNEIIDSSIATFNSVLKSEADIQAMIDGQPVFVAKIDNQVLGFATYFQFRSGVGYAHTAEHTIHLSPAARGRGIGRALMAAIEDHARQSGFHSLIAGISGGNADGIGFHTALGYREVARLPEVGRKWDKWHDLALMQKFL